MSGVKEALMGYQRQKRKIRALELCREELMELTQQITSRIQADKVSASGMGDKLGEKVAAMADLDSQIDQCLMVAADQLRELWSMLQGVDNATYYTVLVSRYIHGMSWEAIAREQHYTLRHTYRLHGLALQELRKSLNVT